MSLDFAVKSSFEMVANKTPVKRPHSRRSFSGPPAKTPRKSKLLLPIQEQANVKPGVVLTFGQGDVGQLGLGADILERSRPAVVSDLNNIVDICAGGMHTVCLTKSGEVITFGCNDEGALGRDTSVEESETIPGKVNIDGCVVQITAGDSHTAALLSDGRVLAWGSFRDSSGTMGLTVLGIQKTPIELLRGVIVVKIASGADHIIMLTNEGQIYTCGCGEQGQLGRVSERGANRSCRQGLAHLLLPSLIPFNPRSKLVFEDIWAGTSCTFAKCHGQIYVFGLNNYNQLGIEVQKCHFHPVVSESFSDKSWEQICGGQHHTIARDSEGDVYALGRKEYGRLGLGDNCEDAKVPTFIGLLKGLKCVDVACGASVSFAVTESGKVYGWGMGTNGQLGSGDDSDVFEPQEIKGKQLETRDVLKVSAGGQHTVLLAVERKTNEEK